MTTTVRGRITGAHRDTNELGALEHKLFVRLLPEDGAVGDLTVNVSPVVYEEFARNFPRCVEVEVKLLFDKPTGT
jgi:hypothetical protein